MESKRYLSVKNFLKYLKAYSLIPIKLTKKFEGDLEGKINAELKKWTIKSVRLKEEYGVSRRQ